MDEQYSLNLDTSGYQQSMAAALSTTNQFQSALGSLTATSALAGRSVSLVTIPVRMLERGFGQFANTAADAQSALAGIRATASVTGQSVDKLSRSADTLARTFPIGNAGAVQLIGQLQSLGVAGTGSEQRIGQLGKTMIQLAAATGSSTSQITDSMSSVSRAFGDTNLDPKRIGKFGDSLTTLTAKFGGTAGGILEFTKNIAPFARQAGIGESATLGIAGAFSKLGDDGASAATAVNKILGDINKSVRDGGPQINTYANIVGKTADQFRNLAKSNPAEALSQVVDALGNGTEGQRALERLGLDGVRTQRALASLSQGGELRNAIATSVSSYGSGSTQTASDAALKGFNNSLTELSATGQQLAITLGTPVLGNLTMFANALKGPVTMLDAIANSGLFKTVMTGLAYVSMAMFARRAIMGVGTTSSLIGLATDNSVTRGFSAGRLLARHGGDTDLGWETAYGHANKRQTRALDALMQMRVNAELAEKNGEKPSFMTQRGLEGAEYALQRPEASERAMMERRLETYRRQTNLYGKGVADAMRDERIAQDAKLQNSPAWKRAFLPIGAVQALQFVARPVSQAMQAQAFLQTQLPRTYLKDESVDRANVDRPGAYQGPIRSLFRNPEGDYAKPWNDLKAALHDGNGLNAGAEAWTARFKSLNQVITSEAQRLGQMPLLKAVRDIGGAYAMPVTTGLQATGKLLGRVGSSALSLAGGPAGLAFLGGSLIAEQAMSAHAAGNQAFADRYSHFSNMSTTETIDSYRDSISTATANTVTLGDQMSRVAKVLDASAVAISASSKLTSDELAQASATRSKIINKYVGSTDQIAAEISGLSANGMTPGEQGAIRVDLARQFTRDQANQIIAKTDWTGKGLTTGAGGTGTLTDAYIASRNAQIDSSYRSEGGSFGSRNTLERLGGNWFDTGDRRSSNSYLWGTNAHLTGNTSKVVDSLVQAQGQVYSTQQSQYGEAYAVQERARTANRIIADAKRQHASSDQIKYLEAAQAQVLGFANKDNNRDFEFDPNSSMSFTDQLRRKNKSAYNTILDPSQGITMTGTGLTPLSQQSPIAKALATVGGGYGAMFDNTKPSDVSRTANASLALPEDMNLLDKAINTVIATSTAAGGSLNDVADNAAKAASALGGDLSNPAVAMQQAIRQRALQVQSFGDAFRTPGQNVALSIQQHTADLQNEGTDPFSVKRRQDAGPALAQDAANLRQMYVDRITQNRQYNIQLGRSQYDFNLSMLNQSDDFRKQELRGEKDYGDAKFRAVRNYNLQVQRTEFDYNEQRRRSQRDFSIQMARGAQDAASSMYAPFQRIAVQQVWDGKALQANLDEQVAAIRKQSSNLALARKEGLSNQAIQSLDLANTANSQQLGQLVTDMNGNSGLAQGLNSSVASKVDASTLLYNDQGNTQVQRSKEDFAKSLDDQAKDFKKSADRTKQDFATSLSDQYIDYTKTVKRAQEDFKIAQDRENTQFKTSLTRMHDDLITGQQVITGDMASLQQLANKGLDASSKDFEKQFTDGLKSAQDALAKFAPGFQQTIDKLLQGVGQLQSVGNQGPQSVTSGGPAAEGGISGGGTASGAAAITHSSYDKHTGETITTTNYVTPGTGAIVNNPRGTGGNGGDNWSHDGTQTGKSNYRPSTDFMNKNPANKDFNKSIAKAMMGAYGWNSQEEFAALDALWTQESDWNQYADSPTSDAYGIPQAMVPVHGDFTSTPDWRTNPATQIAWGLHYIKDRYQDPIRAEQHEVKYGNYAMGGIAIKPHFGVVAEAGSPEAMIPLNSNGVAVLAAAMTKYMTNDAHKSMVTAGSKTYVHYDYSNTHEDHSFQLTGPITVKADDPNALAAKLQQKRRMSNLTKAAVKK